MEDHNKYGVKLEGSRRLTFRNRKHLRRYCPKTMTAPARREVTMIPPNMQDVSAPGMEPAQHSQLAREEPTAGRRSRRGR